MIFSSQTVKTFQRQVVVEHGIGSPVQEHIRLIRPCTLHNAAYITQDLKMNIEHDTSIDDMNLELPIT